MSAEPMMAGEQIQYYGLTTEDAVRAYLEQRLDRLSPNNRWKFALSDHVQGVHQDAASEFTRICPACQLHSRTVRRHVAEPDASRRAPLP